MIFFFRLSVKESLDMFAAEKFLKMKCCDINDTKDMGRKSIVSRLFYICRSAKALLFFPALLLYPGCDACDIAPASATAGRAGTVRLGISGAEAGDFTLDIFIYNDDALQRLDSYQRLSSGNGNTVQVSSRKGKKIVLAVANPQADEYEWAGISSFEAAAGMYADFRLEKAERPVMSGTVNMDAGDGGIHELRLEPLMSEVFIRSIRCDFSGRPYSGASLENACAYLTNVNSLTHILAEDFTPSAPMNSDGRPDESWSAMASPEMVYASFESGIGSATLYPEIRLYCYPNSCTEDTAGTPFTRLVIAGDIDGNRYYYPLNINKGEFGPMSGATGIGRNCRYVFDIVIRKAGNTDPTMPVASDAVSVNALVEPWTVLPESDVEF